MERSKINLYNGDCMEAMLEMHDNAYDLAIVYMATYCYIYINQLNSYYEKSIKAQKTRQ